MNTIQSLGEFLKMLAAELQKNNVDMPYRDQSGWHRLFYQLKKEDADGKPEFLKTLRFDWDGPYPRSQELSEFIEALHWNANVSASNPSFDRISLSKEISDSWIKRYDALDAKTKGFIASALIHAKDSFSEIKNRESVTNGH